VTSFSNTLLSSLIWPFYKNKIGKVVTFVTFPVGIMGIPIQGTTAMGVWGRRVIR
jgi:hypothetical protein